MDAEPLHDLTAAYALDALGADDERVYEEHLARCPRCQAELAELAQTASMLAYGVEAPPPPPGLRERILDEARADRPNVVPLRPRFVAATRAAAAVAACAAVGLAVWAASLSRSLDHERSAQQRIMAVIAEPGARQISTTGDHGTLFVAPTGEAALVAARLERAPAGKTYEVWVVENGKPRRAGLLPGGAAGSMIALQRPVPNGALVAVTLERAGGVDAPTGSQVLTARA
jgi:anti-sigma-K factor RskA